MIKDKIKVSHPGVYVKDAIEALELNQSEFALRVGMTTKNVSTLVNGESNITFEVAQKLADFFGNSVEGWINLQTKYDIYKNAEKEELGYSKDWEIVKYFDKEFLMTCLNVEFDSKNQKGIVDIMRKAFNVTRLNNLKEPDMYAFCKTSTLKDCDEKSIILRNAWISLAEQKARNIDCGVFNKQIILNNLKELRALTRLDPKESMPKLNRILNSAGIKLVILPYLKGSNVSGVTKWIGSQSCELIAINDCGKDAGRIWFTIFHEIGHAIQNNKRHLTISYEKDEIIDKDELAANEFAKQALINQRDYERFINCGKFDLFSIKEFAEEQNVAEFIVVGRLQKEKYIEYAQFSNLRKRYMVSI